MLSVERSYTFRKMNRPKTEQSEHRAGPNSSFLANSPNPEQTEQLISSEQSEHRTGPGAP